MKRKFVVLHSTHIAHIHEIGGKNNRAIYSIFTYKHKHPGYHSVVHCLNLHLREYKHKKDDSDGSENVELKKAAGNTKMSVDQKTV